ncbi:hypothetical protein [Gilliamella sp. Gris1-4]|uniref:hypothetical protein n=1 Tax=Gilliamella sp. Gris1-4 TaxID=3120244 RepID=UPI00080E6EF7|nr:hypothetical protein [Gilliamella apicola]OCG37831.1 hypothetical protein A9G31_00345 [Gilliamella apicola]OCG66880.1 hypothetical protein A9G39_00420 [Gilliamella apicola]
MKGLKPVIAILMSLVLFGCDNSKSDANKAVGDSSKNTDLSLLQNTIINEAKKMLPVKIDAKTNLVEITKDNDLLNYKYIINASKDELSISDTQKQTAETLKNLYCGNNPQLKQFRNAFPNGVSHNYYINDEQLFSVKLTPASCTAN